MINNINEFLRCKSEFFTPKNVTLILLVKAKKIKISIL